MPFYCQLKAASRLLPPLVLLLLQLLLFLLLVQRLPLVLQLPQ